MLAGVAALALCVPVALSMAPAQAAPGKIIYVAVNGNDSNPGTKARPLATIWHASGKTKPGDTVMVRGGVYYLKGTQYIASRGTAKAPITYRSAPGERAVLDGSRTNDGNLVDVRGRYNVIQGFEVRYAKNFGIITLGAMYSKIVGNTVHGSMQSAIGIEGGKIGGDPNPWTVGMQVIGNNVYDNVRGKKLNPKADSAPVVHADYAENVSFIGNRIHDNHQIGIELAIVRGATVAGNRLYNNALHLHLDNASGVNVRDNFMYHTNLKQTNTGIMMANIDWPDSNPLRDVTIRNNVIFGGDFGIMYGTYGRGGGLKNVTIERNTVYDAVGWTLLIVADKGHSNSKIRRNIFVKIKATKNVDVPKVAGLAFSHNCWSGGPAGNAAGPGDVNKAPKFVKPGGLTMASYRQLPGSPCAAMGARPGASSAAAAPEKKPASASPSPSATPSASTPATPSASPSASASASPTATVSPTAVAVPGTAPTDGADAAAGVQPVSSQSAADDGGLLAAAGAQRVTLLGGVTLALLALGALLLLGTRAPGRRRN